MRQRRRSGCSRANSSPRSAVAAATTSKPSRARMEEKISTTFESSYTMSKRVFFLALFGSPHRLQLAGFMADWRGEGNAQFHAPLACSICWLQLTCSVSNRCAISYLPDRTGPTGPQTMKLMTLTDALPAIPERPPEPSSVESAARASCHDGRQNSFHPHSIVAQHYYYANSNCASNPASKFMAKV